MDRRFLAAIGLMMLVVLAPMFFLKRPATPPTALDSAVATVGAPDSAPRPYAPGLPSPAPIGAVPGPGRGTALPEDTVMVRSGLYEYAVSTRGARLIGARLLRYRSMVTGEDAAVVDLVRPGDGLFAMALAAGGDTIPLDGIVFQPSAEDLKVSGPTPLTLTGTAGGYQVELTYTFSHDDYRVDVTGRVTGLGAAGGVLYVGLGEGIRNTEQDSTLNAGDFALVTRVPGQDPEAIRFRSPDVGETRVVSGPLGWAAVKSKYFVIGAFARDTVRPWAGAQLTRTDSTKVPHHARMRVSVGLGADGAFGWRTYAGPMEYPRLGALGNEFNDVNPYGWPGFRTVMRPFALAFRAMFVWMHEHLGLAYGVVLILTGFLMRVVLWPLNQKAMRSAMEMQALQPKLQDLQVRYKSNPQMQQQEMMRLYKEHGVNPLGGCWPMLLPMPILLAIFFVLQGTIELRGMPFLWFPDLSRADPFFIIPILSGLSMFALSKLGQRGIPPNPQAQIMTYMMPVMMTVVGFTFASGLNLYWTASNLASLPQQYLIGRERMKRQQAPVVVKTKK
jgi:YidC/Oxa1 family membrane protein insertase